jgi:hypothetical protein
MSLFLPFFVLKLPASLSSWPGLLDLACKSVVLLLVAGVTTLLLQHASAALRHLVWSVALASLLALPVLSLALPAWRVEWWPASTQANESNAPAGLSTVPEVLPVAMPVAAEVVAEAPAAQPITPPEQLPPAVPKTALWQSGVLTFDWKLPLLALWLAGMLAVMNRLLIGTARIWWLTQRAQQVTVGSWLTLVEDVAARLGLRSQVQLRMSQQIDLGRFASGRVASRERRRLDTGLPQHCLVARTRARQAARLFNADAGSTGLRIVLVQSAGLASRTALAG